MEQANQLVYAMVNKMIADVSELLKQKAVPPDIEREVFFDAKLASMVVDLWNWRNETCPGQSPKAIEEDKQFTIVTGITIMHMARPKLNAMLDSHFAGVEKLGNQ